MNIKTIPLSLLLIITSIASGNKEFYTSELLKAQELAKKAEFAEEAARKEAWKTEEGKAYQLIRAEFNVDCGSYWNNWDNRCKELYLAKYESGQNLENSQYYNEHYRPSVADLVYAKGLENALLLIVSVETNDNYDDETRLNKIKNIISHNRSLLNVATKGHNRLNETLNSLVEETEARKNQ